MTLLRTANVITITWWSMKAKDEVEAVFSFRVSGESAVAAAICFSTFL